MIIRNCSGGIVFYANQVFLLQNEKNEWILPKGKIRNEDSPQDTSLERVKAETGIDAEVLSSAGESSYEFFSVTRKKPVCNQISWYIMKANSKDYSINYDLGFKNGGFYKIDEAMELITYSQDKSLVNLSYRKYKEMMKNKVTA
jgi:8-oxo-dGTP pyrophosphatase MutT (NUDIX family)